MSSHDNKLLLLIKTKGRIANISCHLCTVPGCPGDTGAPSSIIHGTARLWPLPQPGTHWPALCTPDKAWGRGPKRAREAPRLSLRCHLSFFFFFFLKLKSKKQNKNLFQHFSSRWAVRRLLAAQREDPSAFLIAANLPVVANTLGNLKASKASWKPNSVHNQHAWFPRRRVQHGTGASCGSKNVLELPLCI